MSISIVQKPKNKQIVLTDKIIWSILDSTSIVDYVNVRYYAEVWVSKLDGTNFNKVTTLKTVPNADGVGIFDIRDSIESQLGSDTELDITAEYQGQTGATIENTPVHFVDKYSRSTNANLSFYVIFYTKGASDSKSPVGVIGSTVTSDTKHVINYIPTYDIPLYLDNDDYFTNTDEAGLYTNSSTGSFLTDCPVEIDIRKNDYQTFAFQQAITNVNDYGYQGITKITVNVFSDSGFMTTFDVNCNTSNGGQTPTAITNHQKQYLYAGVGAANLRAHQIINMDIVKYYTVQALGTTGSTAAQSKVYIFNIVDECEYPTTRITWLNKFGAWDYYNFNKKTVHTTSAKREKFNAHNGNWNEGAFKFTANKGGSTVFRVDSKDSIVLNSDYMTEDKAAWLEGVITSPEVYIINETSDFDLNDTAALITAGREKIQPVIVTNSSITRKTQINDKMIMHTLNIEKSNNNNTRKR